ncbi:DUF7848 domain-containing protein [Streptomyces sp. NPDC055721]|uniref:DUF7848 domain-containing protein n=1 Tax=Streptomyces sp. NPDC127132 TaxID=3345374 RepID=UPI0036270E14
MTPSRVFRHVTWTLGPDPERDPPARYISCKECEMRSPVSTRREDPDRWALEHSGQTQHRRYRECVAVDLITRPAHDIGGTS